MPCTCPTRRETWRKRRARRECAEIREPRARHCPAGEGRRRVPPLVTDLRPGADGYFCGAGRHRESGLDCAQGQGSAKGQPQRTANPEAHNEYLLGLHLYARGSSDGYARAVKALEKAVALDPGYAVAWAALARAIFFAADQTPTAGSSAYGLAQALPRAAEAANKAIALAPDLAEGWAARGLLRILGYQDWAGARADFERALVISPGDAEILLESATSSTAWASCERQSRSCARLLRSTRFVPRVGPARRAAPGCAAHRP